MIVESEVKEHIFERTKTKLVRKHWEDKPQVRERDLEESKIKNYRREIDSINNIMAREIDSIVEMVISILIKNKYN